MRNNLLLCSALLALLSCSHVDAVREQKKSTVPSADTPGHASYALEGRCPKIQPSELAAVAELEGIYRVETPGTKPAGEEYIQFAFRPPGKGQWWGTEADDGAQYRVTIGTQFEFGLKPSEQGQSRLLFLPLADGFLGIVPKSWHGYFPGDGECRFVVLTKASNFFFAELSLTEEDARAWEEYSDLVRVGEFWIQKHEARLYIKYGTTSTQLLTFFSSNEAWKPFKTMKRKVLHLHESAEESNRKANERYEAGREAVRQKDYETALREFNYVVQLKPTLAQAYLARGSAHFELQHYADALADFQDVMYLASENRDVYLKAGEAAVRKGDFELGFNLLRRASFTPPRDGKPQNAYFTLSNITGKNMDEGAGMCVEAAKLDPTYRPCLDILAHRWREEQARREAQVRMTEAQQDEFSKTLGLLGLFIFAGALLGPSDNSVPSGEQPWERWERERRCQPTAIDIVLGITRRPGC